MSVFKYYNIILSTNLLKMSLLFLDSYRCYKCFVLIKNGFTIRYKSYFDTITADVVDPEKREKKCKNSM